MRSVRHVYNLGLSKNDFFFFLEFEAQVQLAERYRVFKSLSSTEKRKKKKKLLSVPIQFRRTEGNPEAGSPLAGHSNL